MELCKSSSMLVSSFRWIIRLWILLLCITLSLAICHILGNNVCRGASGKLQGTTGKLSSMSLTGISLLRHWTGHKGGLEDQQWSFWVLGMGCKEPYSKVEFYAPVSPDKSSKGESRLSSFICNSPAINSIHMIILANDSFLKSCLYLWANYCAALAEFQHTND